jgi:hypothetical protein
MIVVAEQWISDNIDFVFDYALGFITTTNVIPTPKFHMTDAEGRVAVISCDFWADEDDEHDFDELGMLLDKHAEAFKAVASLLVFVGKIDRQDVVGILTYGERNPKLHYKHLIWAADILDFGPTVTLPWSAVKNLDF